MKRRTVIYAKFGLHPDSNPGPYIPKSGVLITRPSGRLTKTPAYIVIILSITLFYFSLFFFFFFFFLLFLQFSDFSLYFFSVIFFLLSNAFNYFSLIR